MTQKTRTALAADVDTTGAGGTTGQEIINIIESVFIPMGSTYSTTTPSLSAADGVVKLDGTSNTVTLSLGDPANFANRLFCFKAINVDNAAALDPGAFDLEGATTDYIFATVNDVLWLWCDGTEWLKVAEFLNA